MIARPRAVLSYDMPKQEIITKIHQLGTFCWLSRVVAQPLLASVAHYWACALQLFVQDRVAAQFWGVLLARGRICHPVTKGFVVVVDCQRGRRGRCCRLVTRPAQVLVRVHVVCVDLRWCECQGNKSNTRGVKRKCGNYRCRHFLGSGKSIRRVGGKEDVCGVFGLCVRVRVRVRGCVWSSLVRVCARGYARSKQRLWRTQWTGAW